MVVRSSLGLSSKKWYALLLFGFSSISCLTRFDGMLIRADSEPEKKAESKTPMAKIKISWTSLEIVNS